MLFQNTRLHDDKKRSSIVLTVKECHGFDQDYCLLYRILSKWSLLFFFENKPENKQKATMWFQMCKEINKTFKKKKGEGGGGGMFYTVPKVNRFGMS